MRHSQPNHSQRGTLKPSAQLPPLHPNYSLLSQRLEQPIKGPGQEQTAALCLEPKKTLPLCQHRWGRSGWGLFALSTCGQLPLAVPGSTGHCTSPRTQGWYTPSVSRPDRCYPVVLLGAAGTSSMLIWVILFRSRNFTPAPEYSGKARPSSVQVCLTVPHPGLGGHQEKPHPREPNSCP